MAKLKMKYLEIVAPLEQSKEIVDMLQLRSVIELHSHEEQEGLTSLESGRTAAQLTKYRDCAQTALDILNRYAPAKKGLVESFIPELREMTVSEYLGKSDQADELLSLCYKICDSEKGIAEAKAAIARYGALREGLEPWLGLDVPMKFSGTQTTAAFIGTLPEDYTASPKSSTPNAALSAR